MNTENTTYMAITDGLKYDMYAVAETEAKARKLLAKNVKLYLKKYNSDLGRENPSFTLNEIDEYYCYRVLPIKMGAVDFIDCAGGV
jgi:hypothetical protein